MTLTERSAGPDDIKGVFVFRKCFIIKQMQPLGYSDELTQEQVVEMFANCSKCRNAMLDIMNQQIPPLLDQLIDPAAEFAEPSFRDPKRLHSTFGRENAKPLTCIAEYAPGTSVRHAQQYTVHLRRVIVSLEVWNEKVLAQDVDSEHFMYSSYDGKGEGTLFSRSEFVLDNKQMVIGISRLPGGSPKMVMGEERRIPEIQPEPVFSLGKIDELGLKHFFEQAPDPVPDC